MGKTPNDPYIRAQPIALYIRIFTLNSPSTPSICSVLIFCEIHNAIVVIVCNKIMFVIEGEC